jgi:hypothetical protein
LVDVDLMLDFHNPGVTRVSGSMRLLRRARGSLAMGIHRMLNFADRLALAKDLVDAFELALIVTGPARCAAVNRETDGASIVLRNVERHAICVVARCKDAHRGVAFVCAHRYRHAGKSRNIGRHFAAASCVAVPLARTVCALATNPCQFSLYTC